jgi:hypothetical protein
MEWAGKRPGLGPLLEDATPGSHPSSLKFRIPIDAGRRVAVVRTVMAHLSANEAEGLFLVENWDIWPSGAHPPMWEALRRGLGAQQPIERAPGLIFTSSEADTALSLPLLAALFLWDAWYLSGSGVSALYLSHDEFGLAYAVEGAEIEDLESDLVTMKIETKSA